MTMARSTWELEMQGRKSFEKQGVRSDEVWRSVQFSFIFINKKILRFGDISLFLSTDCLQKTSIICNTETIKTSWRLTSGGRKNRMNFGKVSIFCYQFISCCTIGFQSSCTEDVVLIFSQRLSKLLRCTSTAHHIFLAGMFPCQHLGMFYHSQLHVQPLLMELSTYRLSQLLRAVFSLTPSAKMLPGLFSHHEQQHDFAATSSFFQRWSLYSHFLSASCLLSRHHQHFGT